MGEGEMYFEVHQMRGRWLGNGRIRVAGELVGKRGRRVPRVSAPWWPRNKTDKALGRQS